MNVCIMTYPNFIKVSFGSCKKISKSAANIDSVYDALRLMKSSTSWVKDENNPKIMYAPYTKDSKVYKVAYEIISKSIHKIAKNQEVDKTAKFVWDESGTSKLVRQPYYKKIFIARKNNHIIDQNCVCIPDDMKEYFFNECHKEKNKFCITNATPVLYEKWSNYIDIRFNELYKKKKMYDLLKDED